METPTGQFGDTPTPGQWGETPTPSVTKLKGSIGEGPNHSNFSDQNSVRICQNSGDFVRIIQKFKIAKIFSAFSKMFDEIPDFFSSKFR